MSSEEKKLQMMVPLELHEDLRVMAFVKGTTIKEIVVRTLTEMASHDEDLAQFKAGRTIHRKVEQ